MTGALARLRELEAAATPGPWAVRHDTDKTGATVPHDVYCYTLGRWHDEWRNVASSDGSIQGQDDALLIAESRNLLGRLLDVVEAAQRRTRAADTGSPAECFNATVALREALARLEEQTP